MKTTLAVYTNSDDALLLWTADVVDDGCRGFAIERRLRRGEHRRTGWLDNYAPPPKTPAGLGQYQSSLQWPFRRFTWTDHSSIPETASATASFPCSATSQTSPAGAPGAER